MLTAAAMLALGLLVASLARNGRSAGAVGTMLFLPLMFFAGLWIPQAAMPAGLRHVGDDTPLGAAVPALQDSMAARGRSRGLAVLAGYAVAFTVVAARSSALGSGAGQVDAHAGAAALEQDHVASAATAWPRSRFLPDAEHGRNLAGPCRRRLARCLLGEDPGTGSSSRSRPPRWS